MLCKHFALFTSCRVVIHKFQTEASFSFLRFEAGGSLGPEAQFVDYQEVIKTY